MVNISLDRSPATIGITKLSNPKITKNSKIVRASETVKIGKISSSDIQKNVKIKKVDMKKIMLPPILFLCWNINIGL